MNADHYLKQELEVLMSKPSTLEFLDKGVLNGIWYWDLENPDHEWMSPSFWKTLGYDPAARQHLASEWQDLIFPEDGALALDNFNRHCADPDYPYNQLVRYHTSDGGTVTVRCSGIAIREDGVPKRMLGTHAVVHDSRRVDVDQKLSEILEMSSDAILTWSVDDGIQRWNRGGLSMYGYTQTEAQNKTPNDLLHSEYPDGWSAVEAVLQTGKDWKGEVRHTTRQGTSLITSTTLQVLEMEQGKPLFLQIDRDITELHEAKEQQALMTKELKHRVKNLFAVVSSLVRLSAAGETDPVVLADKIRGRVNALAVAHSRSFASEDADGADLRAVVEEILSPFVNEEIAFDLSGDDIHLPQQAITPIGLIVHELATNASKYGALKEGQGSLRVNWSRVKVDEQPAMQLVWVEGNATSFDASARPTGFGTKLVDRSAMQLGGRVERVWSANGLKVTLTVRLT